MQSDIRIISSDIDGAELHREKRHNPYYLRCKGKRDEQEIQEAIGTKAGNLWKLPEGAWERIFGGE